MVAEGFCAEPLASEISKNTSTRWLTGAGGEAHGVGTRGAGEGSWVKSFWPDASHGRPQI